VHAFSSRNGECTSGESACSFYRLCSLHRKRPPKAFLCKTRRTCNNNIAVLRRCSSALCQCQCLPKLFLPAQGYGLVSSPASIYRSLRAQMHVDSRWIWTRAEDTACTARSQHSKATKTFVLMLPFPHRCTCQGVLSMNPSPCSMSATPLGRISCPDRPSPASMAGCHMHSLWCSHGSHLQ